MEGERLMRSATSWETEDGILHHEDKFHWPISQRVLFPLKFEGENEIHIMNNKGHLIGIIDNKDQIGFILPDEYHNTAYSWIASGKKHAPIQREPASNINPLYYRQGKIECIDAIESATVNKRGSEAYYVGNIIKYLWRYENKNGIEDVEKAQWYLNKLHAELTKRNKDQ